MTVLKQQFKDTFTENIPLAPFTTLKVGGPARGFLNARNTKALRQSLAILGKERVPYIVIGKGANLIVPDEGFEGLAIRLRGEFEDIRTVRKTRNTVYLNAGAGLSLPRLLAYAARHGLSGLEPLVAIPGTVGGAIVMNAGVPGFSISHVLSSVTCLLLPSGTLVKRYKRQIHPAYRDMRLPKNWIVLHATFKLTPTTEESIRGKMRRYLEKREGQTWRKFPTAGSIFKNPEGAFAGKLIESCGLKGYRIGDAQISPEHANIIINRGAATARDILALIAHIREEVARKTGITLEPEVVIAEN